jgi:hypothetical protein
MCRAKRAVSPQRFARLKGQVIRIDSTKIANQIIMPYKTSVFKPDIFKGKGVLVRKPLIDHSCLLHWRRRNDMLYAS